MTVLVSDIALLKCYSCITRAFEKVLADHDYDDDEPEESVSDEEYRRQMAAEESERQAEAEEDDE